jgi:hypothetical protein
MEVTLPEWCEERAKLREEWFKHGVKAGIAVGMSIGWTLAVIVGAYCAWRIWG